MQNFCSMEYQKDEEGRDVLLKDGKFQVMMEWEKPYMHACIDALHPCGDVLEVGFGLGYSAERIQSYQPKSHTIIEYHPVVAQQARAFAEKHPGVRIVEGTWQDSLASLGVFDVIFFDDYPLESEEELTSLEKQSAYSQRTLNLGQQLLQDVDRQLPFLKTICYSDEDLSAFAQQQEEIVPVIRFFQELCSRSQITVEQFDAQLRSFVLSKRIFQEEVVRLLHPTIKSALTESGDRLYQFLNRCLHSHMKVGSRFSCFLSSAQSKLEDPQFVEAIILNPLLDFHEEVIELSVPPTCRYFPHGSARVITITKRG